MSLLLLKTQLHWRDRDGDNIMSFLFDYFCEIVYRVWATRAGVALTDLLAWEVPLGCKLGEKQNG